MNKGKLLTSGAGVSPRPPPTRDTDELLDNGWTRSTRYKDGYKHSWLWKREPGYPKEKGCGTFDSMTIAEQSVTFVGAA